MVWTRRFVCLTLAFFLCASSAWAALSYKMRHNPQTGRGDWITDPASIDAEIYSLSGWTKSRTSVFPTTPTDTVKITTLVGTNSALIEPGVEYYSTGALRTHATCVYNGKFYGVAYAGDIVWEVDPIAKTVRTNTITLSSTVIGQMVVVGDYFYAVGNDELIKINPVDLSATVIHSMSFGSIPSIATDGTYLYTVSPVDSNVNKFDLAGNILDFLYTGYTSLHWIGWHQASNSLFISTAEPTSTIARIDLNTFTVVDSSTFTGTATDDNAICGSYLYMGTEGSTNKVIKISTANLATQTEINLTHSTYGVYSDCAGLLYVSANLSSVVSVIDISDNSVTTYNLYDPNGNVAPNEILISNGYIMNTRWGYDGVYIRTSLPTSGTTPSLDWTKGTAVFNTLQAGATSVGALVVGADADIAGSLHIDLPNTVDDAFHIYDENSELDVMKVDVSSNVVSFRDSNLSIGTSASYGKLTVIGDISQYGKVDFGRDAGANPITDPASNSGMHGRYTFYDYVYLLDNLRMGYDHKISFDNFDNAFFGSNSSGDLRIATSTVERIKVLSDGNVGIGSAYPRGLLDVAGEIYGSGKNLTNVVHDGTIYGWTRTSPKVYLANSADNVGIGTSLPIAKLNVRGDIVVENVGTIKVKEPSGGVEGALVRTNYNETGLYRAGTTYQSLALKVNSTDYLDIDEYSHTIRLLSANVGVGTTTPTSKLDVVGVTTTDGLTSSEDIGLAAGKKYLLNAVDSYIYESSDGVIDIVANGVQRMRIKDTADQVIIGTDPSSQGSYPLSIYNNVGSGVSAIGVTSYGASTTFLQRTAGGTPGSETYLSDGNAIIGIVTRIWGAGNWAAGNKGGFTLNADGNHSASNHGTYLRFNVVPNGSTSTATEAMRITGVGVGIGTTAPRGKLEIDGSIYIPAANLATGYALCMTTTGFIGHCTAGTYPACTTCVTP